MFINFQYVANSSIAVIKNKYIINYIMKKECPLAFDFLNNAAALLILCEFSYVN